jgi:hypothetical protein
MAIKCPTIWEGERYVPVHFQNKKFINLQMSQNFFVLSSKKNNFLSPACLDAEMSARM